jgi:hypothetical protein
VHAIAARFIGAGRYYAATPRCRADHHRASSPFRAVALFDGRVEGIEIEMQEQARHGLATVVAVIPERLSTASVAAQS